MAESEIGGLGRAIPHGVMIQEVWPGAWFWGAERKELCGESASAEVCLNVFVHQPGILSKIITCHPYLKFYYLTQGSSYLLTASFLELTKRFFRTWGQVGLLGFLTLVEGC
uniref:Uncharacterized protein n=1 Tax=Sphaerodactylus townsendi TaxID=933632 RepID=A0ACB8FQT7_9SAUR